jgi:hypothetical protein
MLRIFYGENRLEAEKAVKRTLGEGYEVFEGESLTAGDLPSIFQGTSLFGGGFGGGDGSGSGAGGLGGGVRRILLKNLGENAEVWAKLADYIETEHEVVVWEGKIDKRSTGYKQLKEAGVEMEEFATLKKPEAGLVFGILDTAMRNGEKAVRDLEKIEADQDPFMFFGLLVTQALKKYEYSGGGARERRILKELAKVDLQMKSTGVEPWMLIKSFLLRVGEI